ncbi:hypothetical protein Leryth_010817 [Lithospermum erythrorhizon]|nr:hypothetical protein Leryth_010817 [Lithospermum erythrorhizon]
MLVVMDVSEVEEHLKSLGEPKLHGGMCKTASAMYAKVLAIFPDVEATRPRSVSGIQALCTLHIALEKTKTILQHCAECSKLYLAITGDSIVLKFEKARTVLVDSLKLVEDIVPESIGCQNSEILRELHDVEFSIDPVEKQVGDEIIALLQQGRKFDSNCSDNNELESFHEAASKLSITSSRAALRERRALKKLIERARADEDNRKESVVAYLLHLMRKYSKVLKREFSDDNDSQGSTPCSPTVLGSSEGVYIYDIDRQISKIGSFNFKPNFRRSERIHVPPEELRCPISLQLMYDPVIIASGQTYERICIEKWFSDGHDTCPKTQQQLSHLCLTPNYCVKGLVAIWCEQNGVPVPDGPPESLDFNYWRLALSERESNSRLMESPMSCNSGAKVVPLEESVIIEEVEENEREEEACTHEDSDVTSLVRYEDFLVVLDSEEDLKSKCKVVEQIRCLLKDDEEARIYMGDNGFVEPLIQFLASSVEKENHTAQETGAMALFNLAVNNNRNKEMMLSAGVLSVLGSMMSTSSSVGAVAALYMNLSCLEEAKHTIGASAAVPFLVQVLQQENELQCKLDALHALFNLSTQPAIIRCLLSAGIIDTLRVLITNPRHNGWTQNCIPVLINLSSSGAARGKIAATPSIISALAAVLDSDEPVEQEQAVVCLLLLCNGNEKCSQIVLQEGVIPSLVSISVNGTMRAKQKAQKLLMLFREQRQREPSPPPPQIRPQVLHEINITPDEDSRPLSKSTSRRLPKKPWRLFSKTKSFMM